MMSERFLVETIFNAVLRGTDADIAAHKNAVWIAGVTLLADVLLNTDPFNRERLLRGLPQELRDSISRLSQLLGPPAGKLN
jgi:hypothetical protein